MSRAVLIGIGFLLVIIAFQAYKLAACRAAFFPGDLP
jgi:hypothetical protein